MDAILKWINNIDNIVGGTFLIVVLFGCGVLFTLLLGFPQILKFGHAMKVTFGGLFAKDKKDKKGELSSFQALATAVAAQVGTGNVGGVATAITIGGPGAVFWMWVTAILGMSTIFAEAVLGQVFRERKDGELVGGPAFYIHKGIGHYSKGLAKFLMIFFSVAIILALGLSGNMVQSNSIAVAVNSAFSIPQIIVGIIIAALAALIFIGGIDRIGRFAELVVPFMAVVYILAACVLLFLFRANMLESFRLIFVHAFTPAAAIGGFTGSVVKQSIRYGVQRGLFSNEAGMGSTPHAHAVAVVDHPAQQGFTAMAGVFIDTVLVCSATALSIIATGAYKIEGLAAVQVTQEAFNQAFTKALGRESTAGSAFIATVLCFFAFTTVIGWYYFGESNVRYLFAQKGIRPYQIIVILCIILGATFEVEFVWALNALLNNLMVFPNVIALIVLSPLVVRIYKDYNKQRKLGAAIHYDYSRDPMKK